MCFNPSARSGDIIRFFFNFLDEGVLCVLVSIASSRRF